MGYTSDNVNINTDGNSNDTYIIEQNNLRDKCVCARTRAWVCECVCVCMGMRS